MPMIEELYKRPRGNRRTARFGSTRSSDGSEQNGCSSAKLPVLTEADGGSAGQVGHLAWRPSNAT